MKKLMTAWSLVILLGIAAGAHAHPGGHGPITEERALEVASAVVAELSEQDRGLGFGKLDPSWAALPESAAKIHAKNEDYIIVSLFHEKEGRTLYVLMSAAGEVYDANFSGEFPGLEDSPETDSEE